MQTDKIAIFARRRPGRSGFRGHLEDAECRGGFCDAISAVELLREWTKKKKKVPRQVTCDWPGPTFLRQNTPNMVQHVPTGSPESSYSIAVLLSEKVPRMDLYIEKKVNRDYGGQVLDLEVESAKCLVLIKLNFIPANDLTRRNIRVFRSWKASL